MESYQILNEPEPDPDALGAPLQLLLLQLFLIICIQPLLLLVRGALVIGVALICYIAGYILGNAAALIQLKRGKLNDHEN